MDKKKVESTLIFIWIICFFFMLIISLNGLPRFNDKITITRSPPSNNSDYYIEVLSIVYPKNIDVILSEQNQARLDAISEANLPIMIDLYGGKKYTAPSHVELMGETKGGKTYFYYNGYVTTLEGELLDFNEVAVCDFILDSKVFDFKFE